MYLGAEERGEGTDRESYSSKITVSRGTKVTDVRRYFRLHRAPPDKSKKSPSLRRTSVALIWDACGGTAEAVPFPIVPVQFRFGSLFGSFDSRKGRARSAPALSLSKG